MSWLSSWWREFKGGRTDTQTIFSVLVTGLSAKQRVQLKKDLCAIQQTVIIASLVEPDSTQVATAQEWVKGAFEVLDNG